MSTPLLSDLKSILVFRETGGLCPTASTPKQVTVDNSSATTIGSADFAGSANSDHVLKVLEALDGNVKGQMVLIMGFDSTSNVATVTRFFDTPNATQCKVWDFPLPKAPATSAGTTTTVISTERTEVDDYWNQYHLLMLAGANQGLTNITDFAAAADTFTVTAITQPVVGDAFLPVQPMQPSGVTIALGGGAAIEREIVTDTLAQEGILVGAIEESSIEMSPEIRPLTIAAGDGVAAIAPNEMHVILKAIMAESLDTGSACEAGWTTTGGDVGLGEGATLSAYNIIMINGECAAVTVVATDTLTIQADHLSTAPVATDVLYASASYAPQDTGHASVGFMCYFGDSEFCLLSGCMPSFGLEVAPNEIAKYKLNFSSVGGFWSNTDKEHEDVYDTTAPLVGKSNVSRVLLDGVELEADVLSVSADLLQAPPIKGCAFGAFENKGGHFYTGRSPTITLKVYFEDSNLLHKYRALTEFDLLIQVGSVPGDASCLWAPRAQLIESPSIGEEEALMVYDTLTFRCLRPSTAGQPDYVWALL